MPAGDYENHAIIVYVSYSPQDNRWTLAGQVPSDRFRRMVRASASRLDDLINPSMLGDIERVYREEHGVTDFRDRAYFRILALDQFPPRPEAIPEPEHNEPSWNH